MKVQKFSEMFSAKNNEHSGLRTGMVPNLDTFYLCIRNTIVYQQCSHAVSCEQKWDQCFHGYGVRPIAAVEHLSSR